ncbi:50S ribosomal protein L11 methyltransferase [Candidatus Woesearchaeota archaeon]|nr:50S ribosomal protein L11 methyltransferase [Candidatus Woesearchaeota archaeon]
MRNMLTQAQEEQVRKQITAYEQQHQTETIVLPLRGGTLLLDVDPYVANPMIMNSGMQMVNYLCDFLDLVRDKRVTDMGTGSGIVGIAAALLGARKVYMPDIDERAVNNARRNVRSNSLDHICDVFQSDLFQHYGERPLSEVHIFNHPFFAADPVAGKDWTRMMLGGTELLGQYFTQVSTYATHDAHYLLPWLTLAENEDVRDNDPGKRAIEHGYEIIRVVEQTPVSQGIQQALFKIYELRRQRC